MKTFLILFLLALSTTFAQGQAVRGGMKCSGGCGMSKQGITPPPQLQFNNGNPPNGQTTVQYGVSGGGFPFTSTGGLGTITITLNSGTLPAGLVLSASGGLTGVPLSVNTYTFTLLATDTETPPMTKVSPSYSIQITSGVAPPVITTTSFPSGIYQVFYGQTALASGGVGALTWSVTAGSLPTGLSLAASTGIISGTPTALGLFNFSLQACDTRPICSTAVAFSISVSAIPIHITNGNPPNGQTTVIYGVTGTGFQFTSANGFGTPTWSVITGSIPAGLNLSSGGLLSGIPSGSPQTYIFMVQVADQQSPPVTATQQYSIQIVSGVAPPIIQSGPPPAATFNLAYNFSMNGSGGLTPYVWSILPSSASLPPGIVLTNVTNLGKLSGTPTQVGTFPFTAQLCDVVPNCVTQVYSIVVSYPQIVITSSAPPPGITNSPYGPFSFTGAGGSGAGYHWVSSGSMPPGLVLNASTGALTGSPSAAGVYSFTITLNDSALNSTSQNYTVSVTDPSVGFGPPQLPINWVNNHEFDADLAAPFVTENILSTGLGTHAWTCAGLQLAYNDWLGAADVPYLIKVDAGDLPTVPGVCLTFTPKLGATHFIIFQSSNPPARNTTLCGHANGVNGTRALACTNDISHTWHLSQSNVNSSIVDTAGLTDIAGNGPSHIVLMDMQLSVAPTTTTTNAPLHIGTGGENTIAALPSHIHIQYSYIHGDAGDTFTSGTPPGNNIISAGATFNCTNCSMMWNYFDKITRPGSEGHIVNIVNNPGPFKITNNWMEGSSSSVFCGGQVPGIKTIISCVDGEVRDNRFTYPMAWIGAFWGTGHSAVRKNGFELKEVQRMIFDGNIVENVDQTGGQGGPCIDIDVRQLGGGPIGENYIATIRDLTISNNIFRNCLGVQNDAKSGGSGNGGGNATGGANLLWLNNLLYSMDGTQFCKDGVNNLVSSCSPYKTPATETEIGSWGSTSVWTISTVSEASTLVTAVTQLPTNIANGNSITIAGVGVAGYNGTFTVSVVDSTHFTYTAAAGLVSSSGGTATLAQPGCTATRSGVTNNITIVCPTGGNGYAQTNMNPGDAVAVQSCTDTTFNTNLNAIGPPALAGTIPTGLTAVYNNGSLGAATTTGCVLRNNQGWWNNFQWIHNTVVANNGVPGSSFGPYVSSCPIGGNTAGFARNVTYRDNLWAMDAWGGFNGGGAAEGSTGLKPAENCYDLNTFTFHHNAFAERSGANYTAYPSGIKGNVAGSNLWFPTTPQCSSVLPSALCMGFKGMLTNTFIQNPADYHDFQLCTTGLGTCTGPSLFAAGQSQQASDGTDMGANISSIDAAQVLNTYVCGTACGSGPYPSIGTVVIVSPTGSDSNPGSPVLPVKTLNKARTLVSGLDGSLVMFQSGFYPTSSTAFSSSDSGSAAQPIVYRGADAPNVNDYSGFGSFSSSVAILSSNNGSACQNGTAGCTGGFTGLNTTVGNTNAQTQIPDSAPLAISPVSFSNYLYAGASVPLDCYYQPWFLNSGGHNGHVNIQMDESNAANIAAQATAMIKAGCSDIVPDWYGTDVSQAFNLTVSNAWATYLTANPTVALKFAIMIDQGALTPFCPTATNDQTSCLTTALEAQFDYIDLHYGSQAFYAKDSSGRPLVWYFIDPKTWHDCADFGPPCTNFTTIYTTVHTYAQSHYPSRVYQILDENPQSLTEAGVDGGYGWIQPHTFSNVSPNSQCQWDDSTGGVVCNFASGVGSGSSYAQTLYTACKANPTKHCVGLVFKGFDDAAASWGTNRVIQQGCGQLPSLLAAKINSNFSVTTPLERWGLVTWNDYEEGTEVETGIDNCARPSASIVGSNLTYAVNPTDATFYSDSTVDHLTLMYGPNDGTGRLYTALDNIAPGTTNLNLTSSIPSGTWNVVVSMTGKAGIITRSTAPVVFSGGSLPTPNGQTIISGGLVLNTANGFTWTSGPSTCSGTCQEWDLTVPFATLGSHQPEVLYYNGVRRLRPCAPYNSSTKNCGYYTQSSPDGTHLVTFSGVSSPYFPLLGNAPAGQFECYGCYNRDPLDTISTLHAMTGNCTIPGSCTGVQWVEIMAFERWTGARMRLIPTFNDGSNVCNTDATHICVTGLTTAAPPNFGPFAGQRYILDNLAPSDTVNGPQPGQFYIDPCVVHLDCSTGVEANVKVQYFANPGENPNTDFPVIPVNNTIMTANGVSNLLFQNLTFSHDNFTVASNGQPGISDASNIAAANSFVNSTGISFLNVNFSHSMHWALEFTGSPSLQTSITNSITNSSSSDFGTGAFRIGKVETNTDTAALVAQFVSLKNVIANGGQRFMPGGTGVALWIGNAHDNVLQNTTADDWYNGAYGVGASQGFAGLGHIFAGNNHLLNIEAGNIGQGVTSDMGCLHTHSGSSTGNLLSGFYCHDVTQDPSLNSFWAGYNGEGIYIDNSSSNWTVQNGQVVRTTEADLLINSNSDGLGQNNLFSNLILAYGALGCIKKSSDTTVLQLTGSHLICYGDKWNSHQGPQFEGGSAWITPARWSLSSNSYFNSAVSLGTGTPFYQTVSFVRNYLSTAGWQALSSGTNDSGSTFTTDPKFVNPTCAGGDNYQFQSGPPSGFATFTVGSFGAQGLQIPPAVPETFKLQLLNCNSSF